MKDMLKAAMASALGYRDAGPLSLPTDALRDRADLLEQGVTKAGGGPLIEDFGDHEVAALPVREALFILPC